MRPIPELEGQNDLQISTETEGTVSHNSLITSALALVKVHLKKMTDGKESQRERLAH